MSTGTGGPITKPEPQSERSVLSWLSGFVSDTPPYSIRAIGLAVLCFTSALAVQMIFRAAGGSLIFATYYPAVLAAGLLAGLPAGIIVTVSALLTGWWAFMPPQFVFFPLAWSQRLDMATYLLSSGCILFVTERYREALRELRKRDHERDHHDEHEDHRPA